METPVPSPRTKLRKTYEAEARGCLFAPVKKGSAAEQRVSDLVEEHVAQKLQEYDAAQPPVLK